MYCDSYIQYKLWWGTPKKNENVYADLNQSGLFTNLKAQIWIRETCGNQYTKTCVNSVTKAVKYMKVIPDTDIGSFQKSVMELFLRK